MQAIQHLSAADAKLATVIKSVGGYTINVGGAPFQSLVEAIMYQQLAGSAADAIHGRFMALYKNRFPAPPRLLSTPEEKLRSVGLSGRKVEYIRDLATRVDSKQLDLNGLAAMQDEQVIEQLTTVKGIGRPDVLPVGDLGLRKAMQKTYSLRALPLPERMEKIAQPWRPYRSVATWYMWKSLEKFKAIG